MSARQARSAEEIRILMLIPHGSVRGPMPRIAELLVKGLEAAGCFVTTESWGGRSDQEHRLTKALDRFRDIVHIRRVVGKVRPGFVVVQTSHEWASIVRDVALALALRRRAPRIVLQFHGGRADELIAPGNRLLKRATALLLSLTDGVLVLSSSEASALEVFRPDGSFHVVDNPFEPEARTSRTTDGGAEGGALVLFVGRLLVEKGIFETIDALALLNERRPTRLLVAGTGPAEDEVASHVRKRALDDRVTLAGYLSNDRLSAAYDEADVFVLPTYHPEGFPTAITEAMSVGLPIVTTRTRGIGDHLREGVNALFVPPRDHVALAEAVERLLGDSSLRLSMSEANRQEVSKFAPDRVAATYVAALRAISAS